MPISQTFRRLQTEILQTRNQERQAVAADKIFVLKFNRSFILLWGAFITLPSFMLFSITAFPDLYGVSIEGSKSERISLSCFTFIIFIVLLLTPHFLALRLVTRQGLTNVWGSYFGKTVYPWKSVRSIDVRGGVLTLVFDHSFFRVRSGVYSNVTDLHRHLVEIENVPYLEGEPRS